MSLTFSMAVRKGDFHLRADGDWPLEGVTAIFGPSGCGKSTLLRAIAGLERAPGNHLRLNREIYQDGRQWVPPHRRAMGMVFQRAGLFPHLSVRGNLRYARKRRSPGRESGVDLGELGVTPLMSRRVGELSGGERQRVAMARALLSAPALLLMDEPLAALDENAKSGFLSLLEQFSRTAQVPILIVTHSLEEVACLADRVAVMHGGCLQKPVPVAEALGQPRHGMVTPQQARVVLDGVVSGGDAVDGLVRIQTPAGELRVPGAAAKAGTRTRLRIHARDVAIGLGDTPLESALNHLTGTLTALTDAGPGLSLLHVRCGETDIPALITLHSVRRLGLRPGQAVTAKFKSAAIENGGVMGSCNEGGMG
jgi:molybdate transport system ATP-binding protein